MLLHILARKLSHSFCSWNNENRSICEKNLIPRNITAIQQAPYHIHTAYMILISLVHLNIINIRCKYINLLFNLSIYGHKAPFSFLSPNRIQVSDSFDHKLILRFQQNKSYILPLIYNMITFAVH